METTEVKTQKFIVKFFPEIMIKGPSAKRQMINQLSNNLKKLLKQINEDIELQKFSDKIEILCPIDFTTETRQILLQTPGVGIVQEAIQFNKIDTLDQIKVLVNDAMHHEIIGKTFVVRAKRTGTHDFKSTQIEQTVGGYMLAHNDTKGVDLRTAEVTINIELVHNQLYIITLKHNGLGGFPIGCQGEILSLMSGGFDSTVASYLTMKRGIKTHFIFFNLGGIAHEIGVKQVALYLWSKFGSSHNVSFISVPFDDVVTEIFRSTAETYMGVTLKRLMLKASEKIADEMGIDALLTGESVAQVSSQTLRNLALIDQVTSKLILRPLSTMHKQDIMNIANDIGTRRFAETMPEYCGVISKNPVIHGSYKRMEVEAKKFDYSVLDTAVENAVSIKVHEIVNDISDIGQMETISDISSGKYTIIDIRQSDHCIETACETIKIPFFKLKSEFKKLPQDKEYLFYCDKGILSQLHAQYLRDAENYTNIRVYRP
ncbi:tRNA uracil 4-sulfurtransferase ThiI [Poseidonibacter ostreae]|jgi:tRNA uracil 4-sulfurtransferase|uniref:tRNA sulfurtransferase n=1 Tax=Poseidonibacter ostreae TaxID=2654171 RepID=A0A6L4WT22_9BACT|nr:tRNA uracil 4-sulfurtransferase ThiI [Poseidonibacter ostreae]KAB7884192.1 tRNA 4-thiouridine(8) synthase ThiI [Poseidonibacter ostreae]KAB7888098.1 tRNA 4-thiouridine(8) synthase ThiI [Poseidonibacter ostreae]KAB7891713.1 tRNA 4-thiouridine(8) synthase ThiI [Poseidonibacter ostreae]MAC82537.1 tRNA 4-thiouridine(8) synthase ThiI [Arcobacter sp.]